jgi:hypothetical protein
MNGFRVSREGAKNEKTLRAKGFGGISENLLRKL